MGLLDDAIREHLDLKRRRGADPSEVARLEQEALGPVRREPAPASSPPRTSTTTSRPPPSRTPLRMPSTRTRRARVCALKTTRTSSLPRIATSRPDGDPLLEQHAHNVELGGAAAPASEPESSADDADRGGGGEDARPPAEGPVGAHPEPD